VKLLILVLAFAAGTASAHKPSDSYLTVHADGRSVSGQWDIALRDLEYAVGLDADGDGAITWGELKARHAEIANYAFARLALHADARPCRLTPDAHLVDEHSDGAYAVLKFSAKCESERYRSLAVAYSLFFDLDPTHRGQPRVELQPDGGSRWTQFLDYAREGVWHIWIGFDHILFLISLLLPAALLGGGFRTVFWDVFRVVTAFTLAHSITLSLAALSVISLPSRLVESAIALSVVLAALNNLWPVVRERRWMVAFAFGLIHGFGFASVLADLGLPQDALLLALVGFNLGVEAGQLAIVAAFLPLAYALRRTGFYRRVVLVGGSGLIALLAALWLAERALDVKLY
jgi:hypothetical protein